MATPLPHAEIAKFLQGEARTADLLVEQMAKLKQSPVMEATIKRDREYAAACRLVAERLTGWETMGIAQ